ncbi:unnamed protein product [Cuscuta epithymum]|uniref:DUF4079 domain-containing protein n=1 Tax=Cuscuta epithymum TaxID=186058 RepID=A0AAV0FSV8_9ASTE|nr:unnamed protein product [Cuscuta epithymum]
MTIKSRFIVSLYFLSLASTHVMAQKVLSKASPPPPWDNYNYIPYYRILSLAVILVIICAISVVLFKKKYVDRHGLMLSLWTVMLFGSDVIDAWDLRSVIAFVNWLHILVNTLGLSYWIGLGVRNYKKKHTWPPADIMFEIGVWFCMFILSWIENAIRGILRNRQYFRIYNWNVICFNSTKEGGTGGGSVACFRASLSNGERWTMPARLIY